MKRFSVEEARMRAQRTAAKAEQRRQETTSALEAQRAERQAVAEKTARLRALRLVREASDASVAAEPKAKPTSEPRPRAAQKRASTAIERMDIALAKLGRRGKPSPN